MHSWNIRFNTLIFLAFLCFLCNEVLSGGKISLSLPGIEIADWRFGGKPYVTLYERENFRGRVHFQMLGRKCSNLPESKQNWASSVDVQKRCISVCDSIDCSGNCVRIYANSGNVNNKGAPKLSAYDMNDKIKSVKFCYPMK